MISSAPSRRLRFSLRTLLVLVTVLCMWLAWRGYTTRMREALQARHNAFGQALDDYQYFDAYPFMTPAFRQKYSADDFYDQFWNEGRIYPFGSNVDISTNPFSSYGYVGFHWLTLGSYAQYKWELIDGVWYYTGD